MVEMEILSEYGGNKLHPYFIRIVTKHHLIHLEAISPHQASFLILSLLWWDLLLKSIFVGPSCCLARLVLPCPKRATAVILFFLCCFLILHVLDVDAERLGSTLCTVILCLVILYWFILCCIFPRFLEKCLSIIDFCPNHHLMSLFFWIPLLCSIIFLIYVM